MTLDDRLKRAVDTLGDRLRDEISRELRIVTDELSAEAQAQREAAVQAALAASQPPPPAPLPEPPATGTLTLDNVLHAVRAIDNARTLTEVLDALLAGAVAEASLAGVFLVRGEKASGWREERTLELPLAETSAADAVRLRLTDVGIDAQVFPLSLAGETVGVMYAEGGDRAALEIVARHAARALETMTAFKTARSVAGGVASPAASADSLVGEDDGAAARRYARLLISEIKLYHQDAVEAGQRDRDLSQRLGGEIARARTLYDERVPPHVPGAADYFRDELVRTLAGGDASLLADVSAA